LREDEVFLELDECTKNNKKGEQIRFFIRKTVTRLLSIENGINELAQLRTRYLIKITNRNCDEVIYTMKDGIIVGIHILLDCPVLAVYIH